MPASHYETLGIEPSADKEAVKQAYRLRALKYHPDVTGSDDQEARARFVQITEAYEVLRDDSTRRAYDAVRAQSMDNPFVKPAGGWQGTSSTPGSSSDFDAEFEKWWRARGFGQQVDEELLRERRNARRKARSVAWEEEKREASANKARNDRLRWRTANARAERHARVLSRHWQTHVGLCWQDWLVMSAFVASTLCAGALLRGPTRPPDAAAGPGAGL